MSAPLVSHRGSPPPPCVLRRPAPLRHLFLLLLCLGMTSGCGRDEASVTTPLSLPETARLLLPPLPPEFAGVSAELSEGAAAGLSGPLTTEEARVLLLNLDLSRRLADLAERVDFIFVSALATTAELTGHPRARGILTRGDDGAYTFESGPAELTELILRHPAGPDIRLDFGALDPETLSGVQWWNGQPFPLGPEGMSVGGRLRVAGRADLVARSAYRPGDEASGGIARYERDLRGWVLDPTAGRADLSARLSGWAGFGFDFRGSSELVTAVLRFPRQRLLLQERIGDVVISDTHGGGGAGTSQEAFQLVRLGDRLVTLRALEIARSFEIRGPYLAAARPGDWRAIGRFSAPGMTLATLRLAGPVVAGAPGGPGVLLDCGPGAWLERRALPPAARLDPVPDFFSGAPYPRLESEFR